MMEYKRLTFRHKSVDGTEQIGYTEKLVGCYRKEEMILNRLAELEDKIEQGTLIELPCKDGGVFPCEMGETVWLIYKRYWNVADKNGFWVLRESKVSPHNKKRFSNDFGKFVFLTREEAEKRLKELQNGQAKAN